MTAKDNEYDAVSQFFVVASRWTIPSALAAGQSPASLASGVGLAVGMSISRTATRSPGFTRPAKTACWSVMPSVPGPNVARTWPCCSMRSVRPSSTAWFFGSRTVMATLSEWSPSMMSLLPRPSITSLPVPPRRMLPSSQMVPLPGLPGVAPAPTSGQVPNGETSRTGCSGDGNDGDQLVQPGDPGDACRVERVTATEARAADDARFECRRG